MSKSGLFATMLMATAVSCGASSTASAADDGFEPIRSTLKANGLSFYKPVNSMNGPGWLYLERRDSQGNVFPFTLCRNAYDGVATPTEQKRVILPSGTETTTRDLSLSLSLLERLLKNWGSAAINLKRNGVETAQIQWGDVHLIELRDKFVDGAGPRQISRSCAMNVAPYLNSSGNFTEKAYLVVRGAAVRKLEYSFARGKTVGGAPASNASEPAASGSASPPSFTVADVSGSLNLNELLSLSGSYKLLEDKRQGFNVDLPEKEQIFIGGNAIRIKSWRNLDLVNTQAQYELDAKDTSSASMFDQT